MKIFSRTLHALLWASAFSIVGQVQASEDKDFMNAVAEANHFEVQAAQLAQKNASNSQVKLLARMIGTAHQKAMEQLQQVADVSSVRLPTGPGHKDELKKLNGLKGDAFDKEYVNAMVDIHKGDIDAFLGEVQNGKDPAVQNFASQTLPLLQDHLHMAQQTQEQLNGKK